MLERVDEIKAIMHRLHEAERPRFRIGFVPSTLYGRLPEVIRRYAPPARRRSDVLE